MARIVVLTDVSKRIGALTDDEETIGDLSDRETAATAIATLATLIDAARAKEGRNRRGMLIVKVEGHHD